MKSFIVGVTTAAPSTTATQYNWLTASNNAAWSGTEAARKTVAPHAMTIDRLYVELTTAPSAGKSRTFTLMKNGSATSLAVTISDTNVSAVDNSDTVSVSQGDTLSIRASESGTPTASGTVYWNLRQDASGLAGVFGGNNGSPTSGTNYYNPQGFNLVASTDALGQIIIPCAGTIKNLEVYCQVAAGTGNTFTFTLVKNGTPTSLIAAMTGAATTGSDLTGGDGFSVSAGDVVSLQLVIAGTPSSTPIAWGMSFAPTVDGNSFLAFSANGHAVSASATRYSQTVGADFTPNATESNAYVKMPTCTVTGLYVQTSVSPGVSPKAYTFTLRQQGTDTGEMLIINDASSSSGSTRYGGVTGLNALFVAGDTAPIKCVPSSTPTAVFVKTSIIIFDNSAASSYPYQSDLTLTPFASTVTSMPVNMPVRVNSGELLLAFVHVRNAGTFTKPTGWSDIPTMSQAGGASVGQLNGFYKISDGTEGGTTPTWTAGTGTTAEWHVIRVSNWHGTTPPEAATTSGDSSAADPPSLSPSWGSDTNLWISIAGHSAASTAAWSAGSSGYYGFMDSGASSGGSAVSLASNYRDNTASSEDPGAFTVSGSNRWWASATVAVRPIVAGVVYANLFFQAVRP